MAPLLDSPEIRFLAVTITSEIFWSQMTFSSVASGFAGPPRTWSSLYFVPSDSVFCNIIRKYKFHTVPVHHDGLWDLHWCVQGFSPIPLSRFLIIFSIYINLLLNFLPCKVKNSCHATAPTASSLPSESFLLLLGQCFYFSSGISSCSAFTVCDSEYYGLCFLISFSMHLNPFPVLKASVFSSLILVKTETFSAYKMRLDVVSSSPVLTSLLFARDEHLFVIKNFLLVSFPEDLLVVFLFLFVFFW